MTSEVAVMNKEAIALAADSAVTFQKGRGQKIFTSASKIFTMSKYQPVGVMIYGDAELMGVPWETLIKIYREKLGKKGFKTLRDYASNFFSFLSEQEQIFSDEHEERFVKASINGYFGAIKKEINHSVEEVITLEGKISETKIKRLVSKIIQEHFEIWNNVEFPPTAPPDFTCIFKSRYADTIGEAEKTIFQDLPVGKSSSSILAEIAAQLFVKYPAWLDAPNLAGIVIAGFGTEEVFPVLDSFWVEGRVANYVKHRRNEVASGEISVSTNATVFPFAQSEMVSAFMEGVDPAYQEQIDKFMRLICDSYPRLLMDSIPDLNEDVKEDLVNRLESLGKDFFEEAQQELSSHRQKNYISPVMGVVQGLPKDELAAMAESLINLTSFKRRVSLEDETVGGPIDVAVISKGDGFIWIKRKHYFEIERNPQFLANYYKEVQTNDK